MSVLGLLTPEDRPYWKGLLEPRGGLDAVEETLLLLPEMQPLFLGLPAHSQSLY
jgi:hypothetical protein